MPNRLRQDEVFRHSRNLFSGGQPVALDVDVEAGRRLRDGRLESGDGLAFAEVLEDEAEDDRVGGSVELSEEAHQERFEERPLRVLAEVLRCDVQGSTQGSQGVGGFVSRSVVQLFVGELLHGEEKLDHLLEKL